MTKIYNINKLKKSKLIKIGIGMVVITTTFLSSSCSKKPQYYLVTNNQHSYVCTQTEIYTNYDDYDYISIKDDKVIGSICSSRNSFNYAAKNHHVGTKFLSELQVIPMDQALEDEGIDLGYIKDEDTILNNFEDKTIDTIVINHFVRQKYELNKHFMYVPDSTLQLFQCDDQVYVGYDISPDRDFNKNRYVFSIADMDVIEFKKNDIVNNINPGIYLTDENEKNGYVSYDEAINMVNYYKYYHMPKVKKKQ